MSLNPNLKLSSKYSVKDLIPTNTGLFNEPPDNLQPILTRLAMTLETMEKKLGPVTILSGYRSPEVNTAVSGSSTSRHVYGDAVDFYPKLSTAKKYWSMIIEDPQLRNMFGEISWKIPQNAIHVTLPFWHSNGYEVKGSVRVAEGSPLKYRSLTSAEIKEYKEDSFSLAPIMAGMGLPVAILGITALLATFVLKKR